MNSGGGIDLEHQNIPLSNPEHQNVTSGRDFVFGNDLKVEIPPGVHIVAYRTESPSPPPEKTIWIQLYDSVWQLFHLLFVFLAAPQQHYLAPGWKKKSSLFYWPRMNQSWSNAPVRHLIRHGTWCRGITYTVFDKVKFFDAVSSKLSNANFECCHFSLSPTSWIARFLYTP